MPDFQSRPATPALVRVVSSALIALALSMLAGCKSSSPGPPSDSSKLRVVATIMPLADWAKHVGGDAIEASTLLPPNASPHVFEPSASDMKRLESAELLICVGLNMDNWATKLAAGSKKPELALGDKLKERKLLSEAVEGSPVKIEGGDEHDHETTGSEEEHHHHHHDEGGINPHFWLDPALAKASLPLLVDAFAELRPDLKPEFEKNAKAYAAELDALDAELRANLAPVRGRSFVAFHNAYPYLASRYGLKIAAVIEESAGKTPSDRYVREVSTRLRELKIKTVFSEPQLNPRIAQILAEEIGGKTDVLDPYGSSGIADRDTYAKLLRYNADRLAKALGETP